MTSRALCFPLTCSACTSRKNDSHLSNHADVDFFSQFQNQPAGQFIKYFLSAYEYMISLALVNFLNSKTQYGENWVDSTHTKGSKPTIEKFCADAYDWCCEEIGVHAIERAAGFLGIYILIIIGTMRRHWKAKRVAAKFNNDMRSCSEALLTEMRSSFCSLLNEL